MKDPLSKTVLCAGVSMLPVFTLASGLTSGLSQSAQAQASLQATATIHADQPGLTITPHLYGHFTEHLGRCIYDGLWVGLDSDIPNVDGVRTDFIEAMQKINVPNLRWPGGCFADMYHWRDGIGEPEDRPMRINYFWGKAEEPNTFGTHEFMNMCELLGADAYIAGNMGSGTPQEMADWIEYMTFDGNSTLADERRANGREEPWKVPFFGVGNENWGCGGNMTAEYYSDLYRRFSTFTFSLSDNQLMPIACGHGGLDWRWTETVMQKAGRSVRGISQHYYTLGSDHWPPKLPDLGFDEVQWAQILDSSLKLEERLKETEAVLEKTDPKGRVGIYLDEWGTWYEPIDKDQNGILWQQNTLRDALVAGLSFNIMHEHLKRLKMANIAQTVNVLQALVLTEGEKLLLTPTYHVFEMYKAHQGATHLPITLQTPDYEIDRYKMPALSLTASEAESGVITVSIVNTHARESVDLEVAIPGVQSADVVGRILTADKLDTHNTFDAPETLVPVAFEGAAVEQGQLKLQVPAKCVLVLTLTSNAS